MRYRLKLMYNCHMGIYKTHKFDYNYLQNKVKGIHLSTDY